MTLVVLSNYLFVCLAYVGGNSVGFKTEADDVTECSHDDGVFDLVFN